MKHILAYWYWSSFLLGMVFLGALNALYGFFYAPLFAVAMLVFGLAVVRRYKPGLSWEYAHVCMALIVGGLLVQVNPANSAKWFEASLQEIVFRASLLTNDDTGGQMTASQTKEEPKYYKDLTVYNDDLQFSLLVAFNRFGLVLFENGELIQLAKPSNYFLSEILEDDSIVYYNRAANRPVLTRSELRNDGTLQTVWRQPAFRFYLHHWSDAFRGRLYQAGRTFHDLPNELSERIGFRYARCKTKHAQSDRIHVFDVATGEHQESIDLLPILANSDKTVPVRKQITGCKDPLHFNSVQILKNKREAEYFPNGKIGDMLVSLRNVHSIMLIDHETHEVKWVVVGKPRRAFVMQHSPRVTDRGTVVLFDNRGGNRSNGASRIVEIDIATRKVVGMYRATGNEYFFSKVGGKVEYLGDGRVFVVDSDSGKHPKDLSGVFLLDCPDEYISNNCERTDIFYGPEKYHVNRVMPLY